MPLYEYECEACGGRFEVIQKFSETTEECRVCGKGPVRRLAAAPAFQFKGSGWYITDYAQKGKPAEGAGAKSETAGASGAAATDGKPDAGEKKGAPDAAKPAPAAAAKE